MHRTHANPPTRRRLLLAPWLGITTLILAVHGGIAMAKGLPDFAAAAGRFSIAQLAARPGTPQDTGLAATALQELLSEALGNNPEIRAARSEKQAASERIAPAGALEDPMLEAGLLNVPTTSYRLNREEMTMKMLGVAQKLPWPGKRALRRDVAAKEAQSAEQGYRETVNRVARAVKVTYLELALATESIRLLRENRLVLEQFMRIADSRYSLGQAPQADVLKAQTQLGRMTEELLRMEREIPTLEAELGMLVGRGGQARRVFTPLPAIDDAGLSFDALREAALRQRPQLHGLRAMLERSESMLGLARKDYRPDFDVRLSYGQRENMPDGTRRYDMVSLTVAVNLPVWQRDKLDPRIREAQAMREQALGMLEAQQNEILGKLRTQLAIAEQSRRSARLFESAILPQSSLAVESTLSAYRANRADLLMLLDSQMSLYGYRISHAAAIVNFNKALAEIEWLTGAYLPANSVE